MSNVSVLFRKDGLSADEYKVCCKYFNTVTSRMELKNQLVIPRYSCLPYYSQLEWDLAYNNNRMINTYEQFSWVADFHWYDELKKYTFESYNENAFPYISIADRWCVKGSTNSRKDRWNTHMFARNNQEAIRIACELKNDSLIGYQKIIYRRYVPLKTFETGINGLPFTNEFRFFFFKNQLLSHAFYWNDLIDDETPRIAPQECIDLAQEIADIACEYNNFFVLDLAERESNGFILVEVNSGEQSGLSACDPDELYQNLGEALGIVY